MNKSLLLKPLHNCHQYRLMDPGVEPMAVAIMLKTCCTQRAVCIDQMGLTNKAACVSESRCCHISAVINLRINISAASAVELLADFLQPAGRVIYQREGSTDWLRSAELHLHFHEPPRETSEGRNHPASRCQRLHGLHSVKLESARFLFIRGGG